MTRRRPPFVCSAPSAALTAEIDGDPEAARATSMYFTHHGLATCIEAPPHCVVCPLALDCAWLRHQ